MDWRAVELRDGTAPAAGADWTVSVPAGELWCLVTVSNFLAATGVANREVILIVDQGTGNTTAQIPSGVTHLNGESRVYSWSRGSGWRGAGAQSLHVQVSIGEIFVSGGGRIRSATQNIQAADQWNAPRLWIKRTWK